MFEILLWLLKFKVALTFNMFARTTIELPGEETWKPR